MNTTDAMKSYCSNLYRLHALAASGYGESDGAEAVREVMDTDWYRLAEIERTSTRYISEYFSRSLFGASTAPYSAEPLRYLIDAIVDQNLFGAIHFLPLGAHRADWRSSLAVGELMKSITVPDVRSDILGHIFSSFPDGRLLAYWTLSDWSHFASAVTPEHFGRLLGSIQTHRAESRAAEAAYVYLSYSTHDVAGLRESFVANCLNYFEDTKDRTRTAAEGALGLIPLYVLRSTPRTAHFAETIARRYPWSDLQQEAWWPELSHELASGHPRPGRIGDIIAAVIFNYSRLEL